MNARREAFARRIARLETRAEPETHIVMVFEYTDRTRDRHVKRYGPDGGTIRAVVKGRPELTPEVVAEQIRARLEAQGIKYSTPTTEPGGVPTWFAYFARMLTSEFPGDIAFVCE